MSSYRGTIDRPSADKHSRAKAIAAVAAVHVALAFVILSGLNVSTVQHAVERMTTIVIEQPPAPPPIEPPPKPAPQPRAMKKPEGAAAKKAEPTPVVAPQPKLPVPSPLPAPPTPPSLPFGVLTARSGTADGGRLLPRDC